MNSHLEKRRHRSRPNFEIDQIMKNGIIFLAILGTGYPAESVRLRK